MLNYKEKIIMLIRGACSLPLLFKGVFWCMCLTSLFFVCIGVLFLIAGDQDVLFYKGQLQCNH